ncbi:molybdenum cofactor guanylyltransferase [Gracilibacillus caseinilyticus]|uniref:Probable molybdenum cofactor guanylyltransferase n=1 Tax=Gracilibacillus caseinilyticus TaxID=2932256 RepID=A0ABY4EWB8_9BACI|nr:molybdenum cofactor guanylyltransferase [Gracilibacillus caseinilyticus]UOQ48152.1 molybdenum cofactor guanylyltransferase [Gracilibacillus caseinilyticus]
MHRFHGIVLAGGSSSRFNGDKAFAIYQSKPFYQHAIDLLTPLVEQVSLVCRLDQTNVIADQRVSVLTDDDRCRGEGPLAGIYSAMVVTDAQWYLVVPVDTPFMKKTILHVLIEQMDPTYDAIIPCIDGRVQPLVGIYNINVLAVIQKQLADNKRSMHQLLTRLKVKYVSFGDKESSCFVNINSADDFYRYITNKEG